MKSKALGIIVVYYPEYFKSAANTFIKLMRSIDQESDVIVVNNSDIDLSLDVIDNNIILIDGDNSDREFSGWDKGLATAKIKNILQSTGVTIFANDTFNHHNRFGLVSKTIFKNAIINLYKNHHLRQVLGESWAMDDKYFVNGIVGQRWISTYLFAIDNITLSKIGSFIPLLNDKNSIEKTSDAFKLWCADEKLSNHILSWLGYLEGSNKKWYGSNNRLPLQDLRIQGKINSILAEKYFSANCERHGAQIVDIFRSRVSKFLRGLEKKPVKKIQKNSEKSQ